MENEYMIILTYIWQSEQWLDINKNLTQTLKSLLRPKKVMMIILVICKKKFIIYFETRINNMHRNNMHSSAKKLIIMHQKLIKKQFILVNRHRSILLHNKAWLHILQITLQKLAEIKYEISKSIHHTQLIIICFIVTYIIIFKK